MYCRDPPNQRFSKLGVGSLAPGHALRDRTRIDVSPPAERPVECIASASVPRTPGRDFLQMAIATRNHLPHQPEGRVRSFVACLGPTDIGVGNLAVVPWLPVDPLCRHDADSVTGTESDLDEDEEAYFNSFDRCKHCNKLFNPHAFPQCGCVSRSAQQRV